MRVFVIGALVLCACSAARAVECFIDPEHGSDANPGTTEASPLRTLEALAALRLQPGDVVRLKRGSTFRGRLQFQGNGAEGNPIRLTTYGEGPKPEILGSITLDGWEQHEGEVYRAHLPPDSFVGQRRVHSVFEYDDGVPVRLLRADQVPEERGRFFFDEETSELYVVTTDGASPAEHRVEVPVIEELVTLAGRSWIEIEGIAFLFGNCRHISITESHDVVVRDCASLFVGLYGNPNVLIHRNSTRVELLDSFLYENVNCGVFISSGATQCRVAGCTIVKCASNDGVTCHSGGRDERDVRQGITGDHNIIENNVIGLCPEESIDITSGDYHVIRGNICYGNGNPGIIVGHDSDHILIENNICFRNARSGIQIGGQPEEGARGHNRVVRNLAYENGYPGLEIQGNDTEVLNNTVVNSRERVAVRLSPGCEGSALRNNILATLDPTIPHPILHFLGGTPTSFRVTMGHNLLFHEADRAKPDVFYPAGALIRTDDGSFGLMDFVTKYGTGEASLMAEPQFVGIEEGGYFLSPGSPAVDAGVDVGLPFAGDAPDLGWKELGDEAAAPRYPPFLIDGEDDQAKILYLWGKAPTHSSRGVD
jgi:hypothetical protein